MVSALRLPGCCEGYGDSPVGARAAGVAADDAAGDGAPLPVHRVWACVAPGHEQGRRAAGEAVTPRAAVGAGRHRVPAPDCGPGRRRSRGRLEHRNAAVLAEGTRLLIDDEHRFDGVQVIGVDEHVWRHTRRGDKCVTVIIDLTPIRDGTGPARLLDMVEGRSKQAFKAWLADRPPSWRQGLRVVAMDGFTGFKTATTEELPAATAVMDPFHVVRLGGDALDRCRRRVQHDTRGHRGHKDDPLYAARRTLHTGAGLLTDKQKTRLDRLFADDAHVEVEATWGVYQQMITAYREPDRRKGRAVMSQLIESISTDVPSPLTEIITLGRTLKKRAADVLAYFYRPGTSNGPTEAINGRLEHLRGSALGFRNLTHYIARSLLETGGFRPRLHPRL